MVVFVELIVVVVIGILFGICIIDNSELILFNVCVLIGILMIGKVVFVVIIFGKWVVLLVLVIIIFNFFVCDFFVK